MTISPILRISDGTNHVDLITNTKGDIRSGIALMNWSPSFASVNNDGIWQQSLFYGGRKLLHKAYGNIIDTYELAVIGVSQNDAVLIINKMQALLEKGVRYWLNDWNGSPVWLEAKSGSEERSRYAVIYDYRMSNFSNPYAQPFASQHGAVMQGITLVVEHGPWLGAIPGDAECMPIRGYLNYPYYLEFSKSTSRIDCGSPASLDDLPNGSFTAEAWVYPRGYGGLGYGAIMWKYASNIGWHLRLFNNSYRLEARIECSTTDAYTRSSHSLTPERWNHVAITYNSSGTRKIRMWINGEEVTYTQQVAASGTYNSDNAQNLYIGNDNANSRNWDGYIGWVRLSTGELYSSNFTPPDRCRIPAFSSSTRGLWLHDGYSATTTRNIVNTTGSGDGTITDAVHATDCRLGHADAVCASDYDADEWKVYWRNAFASARIDYLFYYDASLSLYSDNLIGKTLPYQLLPNPVQAGDYLYVGSRDLQYFDNVVFNLTTPGSGYSGSWQYWNGSSWVSFIGYFFDETSGLTASGVKHVYRIASSTNIPQQTTVNGFTAYWWRFYVSLVTSPTTPMQGERDVYCCTWPYITVDNTSGNDIDAFGELCISSIYGSVSRLIVGKRSKTRGTLFQGYINAVNLFNTPGVSVLGISGVSASTNWMLPLYHGLRATTTSGSKYYFCVRITDNVAQNYYGRFRLFVRYSRNIGGTNTGLVKGQAIAEVSLPDTIFYTSPRREDWVSREVSLPYTGAGNTLQIADFGEITIPSSQVSPLEPIYGTTIFFKLTTDYNNVYIDFADIILMPVDEWYADLIGTRSPSSYSYELGDYSFISIDSARHPRNAIRAPLFSVTEPHISTGSFAPGAVAPLIFGKDSEETYWILPMIFYSPDYDIWFSGIGLNFGRAIAFGNRHYLTFRGTG